MIQWVDNRFVALTLAPTATDNSLKFVEDLTNLDELSIAGTSIGTGR